MTDGQFLWACILAVTALAMTADMAVRAAHRRHTRRARLYDWAVEAPELRQPSHVRKIA